MDPLTQGLLGAVAGCAVGAWLDGRRGSAGAHQRSGLGGRAAMIGFVAGLTPDADVVVPVLVDLELPHTYHRHFSHALIAIPFGAAVLTLLFAAIWPSLRRRWRGVFVVSFAAWATHGPLDACTSYGTHLLWPFDSGRVAWDCLPIIDPILTTVLLVCVAWTVVTRRSRASWIGLAFFVTYAGLGLVQRERAESLAHELVAQRGHRVERLRVIPLPLSLVGWRLLYETPELIVADGLRVPFVGQRGVEVGGSLPRPRPLTERTRRAPETGPTPRFVDDSRYVQLVDDWLLFCDAWTAPLPGQPQLWGDLRFCKDAGFAALWAVEPRPGEQPAFAWHAPVSKVSFADLTTLATRLLSGRGFRAIR